MNIDHRDNSPEMKESRQSAQSAVCDNAEGQVEDVEQATANAGNGGEGRRRVYDWRADLEASRNLSVKEKSGFGFVIGWMEEWRMKNELPPGLETARDFWRRQVKVKERAAWQLEGWTEGIRWYLNWLELCERAGGDGRSLPERMRDAVDLAGARRGLALRTRRTYAGWVARFGVWAGSVERAMDTTVAREWLAILVKEDGMAFATQKQALNALVFYFRDVCDQKEIDLQVRMRKRQARMPVVLDVQEVLSLIDKLEGKGNGLFQLAAKLQYGSGLRVSELASLRIKDVDLARRTITVRAGKGDRDRVTVLPEGLVDELSRQIATARILYDSDRAAGRPGVALPGNGGLERKMPKAGVRWEWFWLFPVEIYTHVAKGVGHSGIRSPLDRL